MREQSHRLYMIEIQVELLGRVIVKSISETKRKLAIFIVSDTRLQQKPSTCQNHSNFCFGKKMFVNIYVNLFLTCQPRWRRNGSNTACDVMCKKELVYRR